MTTNNNTLPKNSKVLNINVGILGHVDSGKTSLAKCLSHVKSTAAFDKHPQSQERGITIDLGFSSLKFDVPKEFNFGSNENIDELQLTLVDCPGHASLFRTVIGGSQIIDVVLLVIDVTKGVQTQTAECLILAEITCKKMMIVLNKIDLIPEQKRDATIAKIKKKMKSTLSGTPFSDSPVVCTSALPTDRGQSPIGLVDLIETLKTFIVVPKRFPENPFVFAVDHCFGVHGQGTVMTGTVIQGSVGVNDLIEIPVLKLQKKIKSMQVFRKNVNCAVQGDRLGICIKQLDPGLIERAIICKPGYAVTISAGIIDIKKIKYFKSDIKTGMKFHISVCYETVIAKVTLFSVTVDPFNSSEIEKGEEFSINNHYLFNDALFDGDFDGKNSNENNNNKQFALLEFEKPVLIIKNSLVIGSRFDMDCHTSSCRLAFSGNLIYYFDDCKNYRLTQLPLLKVYKVKEKYGIIDRTVDENEIIGKNIFKKETDKEKFFNFKVTLSTGEWGIIDRSFGKSGKIAIRIPAGLSSNSMSKINKIKTKRKTVKNLINVSDNGDITNTMDESIKFTLTFKKMCFDNNKTIFQ